MHARDPLAQSLARLVDSGDVTWAPSYQSPAAPEPKPLFFYHVPKTGGLSFYLAMAHAFSRGAPARYAGRKIGRYDDPIEAYEDRQGQRLPMSDEVLFAATHHEYGFHERFRRDFALATILRDPVQRVTSAYTYLCMRTDKLPTEADFKTFFRRSENTDLTPSQFLGMDFPPDRDDATAMMVALLQDKFDAFVPSGSVTRLLSSYLSIFGLPNVLLENLNQTLPRYRIDAAPWAEEIRSRNTVAWAVHRHVADHPRFPHAPQDGALHPLTVIVRLRERRARTLEESLVVETAELTRLLEGNPEFWRVPPVGE